MPPINQNALHTCLGLGPLPRTCAWVPCWQYLHSSSAPWGERPSGSCSVHPVPDASLRAQTQSSGPNPTPSLTLGSSVHRVSCGADSGWLGVCLACGLSCPISQLMLGCCHDTVPALCAEDPNAKELKHCNTVGLPWCQSSDRRCWVALFSLCI